MAKVYQIEQIAEGVSQRVTALQKVGDLVFVGDARGSIQCFSLHRDRLMRREQSASIRKGRIDKLKAQPHLDYLYGFSQGILVVFDIQTLQQVQNLGKGYTHFALNEDPNSLGRLCVIQKRKAMTMNWSSSLRGGGRPGRGGHTPQRDNIMLPDVPASVSYYGQQLFIAFQKRNYMIYNTTTGANNQVNIPHSAVSPNYIPRVKIIGSEFFCLWTNLMLPFDLKTERPVERTPISFEDGKNIVAIGYDTPYIVLMTDRSLEIYNHEDSARVQQEVFPSGVACVALSDRQSPIVIATTNSVYMLKSIPLNEQISKLLKECKIKEARILLQKNIDPFDENMDAQYQMFSLDAAWSLFTNIKFSESAQHFILTNFDPRDIMSLFPEYCDSKLLQNCRPNSITIDKLVEDQIRKKANSQINPKRDTIDKVVQFSKLIILSLLKEKREKVLRPPKAAFVSSRMEFTESQFAVKNIRTNQIGRDQLLELLDTFLLKMIVSIGIDVQGANALQNKFGKDYLKLLQDMFQPSYKASLNFTECENYLKSKHSKAANALAMLYQAVNRKVQALRIWRDIGITRSNSKSQKEQAAEQTQKILSKMSDRPTIFDYSMWVLQQFPKIGLQIFKFNQQIQHISYDDILLKLSEFHNDEFPLRENYLKYLVDQRHLDSERFHTQLALCYIEKLFSLLPRTYQRIPPEKLCDTKFERYRKDLILFLKMSTNYRSVMLLDQIRGSWMIEAIVLLLSRERQHMEALNMLVEYGEKTGEFDQAEIYCTQQKDNLLTKLLQIYISKAENLQELINNAQDISAKKELEKNRDKYIQCASKLLKKYAIHPQLDPVTVMDVLPDDWSLNSGRDSFLMNFLVVALSNSLHQGRTAKVLKQMSDMELMQTECELTQKRKASVRIKQERVCDKCRKRIGDKPFYVYPNSKVVHLNCVSSVNICPVTNTNFKNLLQFMDWLDVSGGTRKTVQKEVGWHWTVGWMGQVGLRTDSWKGIWRGILVEAVVSFYDLGALKPVVELEWRSPWGVEFFKARRDYRAFLESSQVGFDVDFY